MGKRFENVCLTVYKSLTQGASRQFYFMIQLKKVKIT